MTPPASFDASRLSVPGFASVAADLEKAEAELGVPWLLVGALARDVALMLTGDRLPHRATRDVDVAVAVPNWNAYEGLVAHLCAAGYKRSRTHAHRLQAPGGSPVDLVPFGGIEEEPGKLVWPPRGERVLTTLGFEAALGSAVRVQLKEGPVVRIASLPMLAVLKLVAWSERKRETPRDAEDLALLLQGYGDTDDALLYDAHADLLDEADFDLRTASARMLGRDAATLLKQHAREETSVLFHKVLAEQEGHPSGESPLALAMSPHSETLDEMQRLLRAFHQGVNEGR